MRKVIVILMLLFLVAACQDNGNGSDGSTEGTDGSTAVTDVRQVQPTPVPTLTPTPPLPTPQPIPVRGDEGHIFPVTTRAVHVVRPGDTMTKIANQYGVTVDSLRDANRIYNYDLIYVGDVLYIPPCD